VGSTTVRRIAFQAAGQLRSGDRRPAIELNQGPGGDRRQAGAADAALTRCSQPVKV